MESRKKRRCRATPNRIRVSRSNPAYNPETDTAAPGPPVKQGRYDEVFTIAFVAILLGLAKRRLGTKAKPVEPSHATDPRTPHQFQDKNFYLFSMLSRMPALRDAIKADPAMARIASERLSAMDTAAKSCKSDSGCYTATRSSGAKRSRARRGARGGRKPLSHFIRRALFTDGAFARKRHVRSLQQAQRR